MATATITEIQGTPTLTTRTSAGTVLAPGTAISAWSAAGSYIEDDGSTMPLTFTIMNNSATPYSPAIIVTADITLTSQYSGTSFDLEGYLTLPNGAQQTILTSVGNEPPSPLPNPPVPFTRDFDDFQFHPSLNLINNCPVPFRIAGDIRWKLTFMALPVDLLDVNVLLPTRLEISYARASAPAGPTFTANGATVQTAVDLGGVYPIGLLRFFLPSPLEFAAIAGFYNSAVYGPWFAARVVWAVWSWGNPQQAGRPQYDALNGASWFNVGRFGGSFNLATWLAGAQPGCNCYDLAAILQLGCCLLQSSDGDELLASHWVYQNPNGYILQCVLYGWGETYPYPNGVNNPFFLRQTPHQPYINGTAQRTWFGNHAWIEILQDPYSITQRRVLDATTAAPRTAGDCWPDDGSRGRVGYALAHVDQAADPTGHKTGDLQERIKNTSSSGSCYVNYEWWTDSAMHPGTMGRIGVWNADGINPPPLVGSRRSMPEDEGLFAEIELLLIKGRNPVLPAESFNNARITGEQVASLVSQGDNENLRARESSIKVIEGMTLLEIQLTGARFAKNMLATLSIKMHIFGALAPARAALIHALSSFTPPNRLSEHFVATNPPLAETALIDVVGQSLHSVRGNIYVQLRLVPTRIAVPDSALMQPLEPLAVLLDNYLAEHSVPPGRQLLPELELRDPSSAEINVGEFIGLEAVGDYAIVDGSSSNAKAVICMGKKEGSNRAVEFLAVAEGEAHLCLHVAHGESLLPATKTRKVTISRRAG